MAALQFMSILHSHATSFGPALLPSQTQGHPFILCAGLRAYTYNVEQFNNEFFWPGHFIYGTYYKLFYAIYGMNIGVKKNMFCQKSKDSRLLIHFYFGYLICINFDYTSDFTMAIWFQVLRKFRKRKGAKWLVTSFHRVWL